MLIAFFATEVYLEIRLTFLFILEMDLWNGGAVTVSNNIL